MQNALSNLHVLLFSQTVRSVTLEMNGNFSADIIDSYVQRLLWEKEKLEDPPDIFRLKVRDPSVSAINVIEILVFIQPGCCPV